MGLFSKFMNEGPVRKRASGSRSSAASLENAVQKAPESVQTAFRAKDSEKTALLVGERGQHARLEGLLDVVKSAEPDLVDGAVAAGYRMGIGRHLKGDVLGNASDRHKLVWLNMRAHDVTLVVTLAHELEHAAQFERMKPPPESPDLYSRFLTSQAMEGGAFAKETLAAYKIGKTYPAVWQCCTAGDGVKKAVSEIMDKDPSAEAEALQAGFKAFFKETQMTRWYADYYADAVVQGQEASSRKQQRRMFTDSVDPKAVLNAVCSHQGKPYLTEGISEVLSDMMTIDERNFSRLKSVVEKRAKKSMVPDRSLEKMTVVSENGAKRSAAGELEAVKVSVPLISRLVGAKKR